VATWGGGKTPVLAVRFVKSIPVVLATRCSSQLGQQLPGNISVAAPRLSPHHPTQDAPRCLRDEALRGAGPVPGHPGQRQAVPEQRRLGVRVLLDAPQVARLAARATRPRSTGS